MVNALHRRTGLGSTHIDWNVAVVRATFCGGSVACGRVQSQRWAPLPPGRARPQGAARDRALA
jgi:hypothetical protein